MSSQKQKILAVYQAHSTSVLHVDTIVMLTKIKRKSVQGRLSELVTEGKIFKVKKCKYKFLVGDKNNG